MLRKLAYFTLFFAVLAPRAEAEPYVQNVGDFYTHMYTHVVRVRALGVRLYDNHPELFSGISRRDVLIFLSLHDQSKINITSGFLRRHKLTASPMILTRLYEYYGKDLHALSGKEKSEFKALIHDLNGIDVKIQKDFMRKYGFAYPNGKLTLTGKRLLRIEKIADFVDRGMSPVSPEEFNKVMERASTFLKDPEDRALARELEAEYAEITKKYDYGRYRERFYTTQRCTHFYQKLQFAIP